MRKVDYTYTMHHVQRLERLGFCLGLIQAGPEKTWYVLREWEDPPETTGATCVVVYDDELAGPDGARFYIVDQGQPDAALAAAEKFLHQQRDTVGPILLVELERCPNCGETEEAVGFYLDDGSEYELICNGCNHYWFSDNWHDPKKYANQPDIGSYVHCMECGGEAKVRLCTHCGGKEIWEDRGDETGTFASCEHCKDMGSHAYCETCKKEII